MSTDDPKAEEGPGVAAPPHAVEPKAGLVAPVDPIDLAEPSPVEAGEPVEELGEGLELSPSQPATKDIATGPIDGAPIALEVGPPADLSSSPILVTETTPKRRRRWGRALLLLIALLILWPPVSVLALKVIPPPFTILMLERLAEGRGLDKSWRSLDRIAPSLPVAVIAAEDAKFCEHDGFDWDAIRIAAEHNERSPAKVRGGSTISQQTAKNVFLWPARDYVRKGLEAGYTVLIEKLWGKRRILEAYLNVVEWGPGLYGAQAAAQRYFHEDASRLSPEQSARLAAILPSPLKWKAVNPGRYVMRRSRKIGANAQLVRTDDLAWCVRR